MNLQNFQINSDYPMDKIVLLREVRVSADTVSFAHGFSSVPLVFGIWSTTSSFATTRTCGMQRSSGDPVICWATTSSVFALNYGGAARPVYVRIYALLPVDSTSDAAATSNQAQTFIFNSDYRYMPLIGSYTATGSRTFAHGLGYKPRVLAWTQWSQDSAKHTELLAESSPSSYDIGDPAVLVTTSAVRVIYPSSGVAPGVNIHLRIYG